MELVDLAEAPGVIPLLAEWHVREWGDLYPDWSVPIAIAELEAMLHPHGIPRTIVAFDGHGRTDQHVVGSVSVIDDDELAGFEQSRPWLASLYVAPAARRAGLGARLVAAAVQCARELGERDVHLFTAGQQEFYEKLGWRPVARAEKNGHDVTVLKIETATTAARRCVTSRWCSSPFSRGAYSYVRPSGTPADRQILGEAPHPGLRLAGEAASAEFPGTLHGAWFSGAAAAASLIGELGRGRRVVVVGAGVAGISAARSARDGGAGVTIVEALSRPGGRAATDRRLGGAVNLGAAWLHGSEGHPLFGIASRLGGTDEGNPIDHASTFVADAGDSGVDPGGREIGSGELTRLRAKMDSVTRMVERAAATAAVGDSVADALAPALAAHASDPTARAVLACWARGEYDNLYAAPPADLSLRHGLEPFRLPGPDVMVTVGIDELLAGLTTDLDIRYDFAVDVVRRQGRTWSVRAGGDVLEADGVIVTVSTGVLNAQPDLFDPPLPSAHRDALSHIGLGRVAKAFFTFDEAYWRPRRAFWLAAIPPPVFELWVDASSVRGAPTLCAFATGANAELIENMSEDELLELAFAELRSARGLVAGGSP